MTPEHVSASPADRPNCPAEDIQPNPDHRDGAEPQGSYGAASLSGAWRIAGESARGAAHIRMDLPNQDAIKLYPDTGLNRPPLIVAISDGHGSARHFRSARGAQIAVEAAIASLREFNDQYADRDFAGIQAAMSTLPPILVNRWREAVTAELAANPLGDRELAGVEAAEGEASRESVQRDPLLAYGATIIAVLLGKKFILFLQLGDGDVLCVDAHGATSRVATRDPRLTGNYSSSLCQPDAAQWMRLHLVTASEAWPELILLCSDGYANSFASEEDFLRIGRDYLDMIRARGLGGVTSELPRILSHASTNGSGDDISLGILTRVDAAEARAATEIEGAPERRADKRGQRRLLLIIPVVAALVVAALVLTRSYLIKAPHSLRVTQSKSTAPPASASSPASPLRHPLRQK